MKKPAYVIITPARDEQENIVDTIRSVAAQTIPVTEWVIVDDGSTDGTAALLDTYARKHSWISVIHLPNRGRRDADTGAVGALLLGYKALKANRWEFLVNLDADLALKPDYFEKCFEEFRRDPHLGIGGGTLYHYNGSGNVVTEPCPKSHVRGATKIYRRACWESFGGHLEVPGWDTLDEIKAGMAGWRTHSFAAIWALHKRPTGGADGSWRDALKNGRCDYFLGYHPLFMVAKCLRRLAVKPYFLNSLGHLCGYLGGYLKRRPQIPDPAVLAFLRKRQLRRLLFLAGFSSAIG